MIADEDKAIAEAIKRAANDLNDSVRAALVAGLEVECEFLDLSIVGQEFRQISVKISKVTK